VAYSYNLKVNGGLTPMLTDEGTVEFRNSSDQIQFLIPPGTMTDSASPEPAFSGDVPFDLQETESGWRLTMTPDLAWLNDPARVYPVLIDPTVTQPGYAKKDCFLQQEAPATTHCGETVLKVGATNSLQLRRALLDFDLGGVPGDATINSAYAFMFMDAAGTVGSGGATTYALYNPTADWGNCASWAYTCNSGGTWTGGGNQGQVSTNAVSLGGSTSGWQVFDISNRAAGWRSGAYPNRGVLLRQTGENVKKVLSFHSHSTPVYPGVWDTRPFVWVTFTYNAEPASPTELTSIDGDSLAARVWDPDGNLVRANFDILYDGVVVWSQSSTYVPSGSVSRVIPPFGMLNSPSRYSVRVYADDGQKISGYTTGKFVRDPQGMLLLDATTIAKAVFANEAAAWDSGSQTPAQTETAVKTSMIGGGMTSDVAASNAADALSIAQAHTAKAVGYRALLLNEQIGVSNTIVTPTVISHELSPNGDQLTLRVGVETWQRETDLSTGQGDQYVDEFGNLSPIEEAFPSDPALETDPEVSSWVNEYTLTFSVATKTAIGSDGHSWVVSKTPTLTGMTNSSGESVPVPSPEDAPELPPITGLVPVDPGDLADGQPVFRSSSAASSSTYPLYNPVQAAHYAKFWTNRVPGVEYEENEPMNQSYPDLSSSECTNFVSQALAYAGMPMDSSSITTSYSFGDWDYDIGISAPTPYTYTWAIAEWFAHYMKDTKRAVNRTKNKQMIPGDVILYDWDGGQDQISHINIITVRTRKGVVKISQKSGNRHNVPYPLWKQFAIEQGHPNVEPYVIGSQGEV
jgi:hypothetical protein